LHSGRAAIIASGGISIEELATYFNAQPFISTTISDAPEEAAEPPHRAQPILVQDYPNSEQVHLIFGFDTVSEAHVDFWPLNVLSRILGGATTARLNQKLRFELGLVYGAGAGTS